MKSTVFIFSLFLICINSIGQNNGAIDGVKQAPPTDTSIHYPPREESFSERISPNDISRDSVIKFVVRSVEIEAQYSGGHDKLDNFLKQNLNSAIPLQNGAPKGDYQFFVKFIVRKNGTLCNFGVDGYFDRDVSDRIADNMNDLNADYGMATEAIRVLKTSGKWKPGINRGQEVDSYTKVVIHFIVQ